MISTNFSRRGFLTRLGAGGAGLLGASTVGGWFTRAWATPLRDLRATGLPRVDEPQSIVRVGPAESLRREEWAYQLPEFQLLVGDLAGRGYKRVGDPLGVDGVAGYVGEGAHVVIFGFAEDGSDKVTSRVVARWWDEAPEREMPDVFSTEVFDTEAVVGPSGTWSLVRFRYVDDHGGVATRDERVNPGFECDPDCHTNPPGHCHEECTTCLHCIGPTNICRKKDEGCDDFCEYCAGCAAITYYPAAAACTLMCGALCGQGCSTEYCCDYVDKRCCWNLAGGGLPVPYCV